MAEDLTDYLASLDFRVRYLHSDIDTMERSDIVRDLRLGLFDILIGINLLREGLDIPEVALVAILDADKEGFLRSARSLIQTSGRASRNAEGRIIMYADTKTESIKKAISESMRRRVKQLKYNEEHGIIPKTIERKIQDRLSMYGELDEEKVVITSVEEKGSRYGKSDDTSATPGDRAKLIQKLEKEMREAAKNLEFEKAARLRDRIVSLKQQ
jgi:excinuclease ABC subunit B